MGTLYSCFFLAESHQLSVPAALELGSKPEIIDCAWNSVAIMLTEKVLKDPLIVSV